MKLDYLLDNYFVNVGKFTKDLGSTYAQKTTHICTIPHIAPGVYALVDDNDEIVKFGETQDIKSRIQYYAQGGQETNIYLREQLEDGESFRVFFYEAKTMENSFAGVRSRIVEDYKDAEGKLLDLFFELNDKLPKFNKARK